MCSKDDVAIGISTSGNSENVLEGIKTAKKIGAKTIGFSGSGGKLKEISDICICVPSNNTPRIQEIHITIGHILCKLIEDELFS
jgi:D-sedoheptulose 7-phosphate isomerase